MSDSLFSSSGGLDPEVVKAAREELRRRLPELRDLPGFPIGSDEDILKMSVPPYYTACPNPFIADWLEETKPDGYDDREYVDPGPFVSDVSEGKTHPIYKAHAFWTKVPHQAIMRYILHYTQPGDVVLDGFSGSGMTGVAAQACGAPEPEFRQQVETEIDQVEWGARRAVLQDLSPIATFISAGLNLPVDTDAFDRASQEILDDLEAEWGWMYETTHTDGSRAKIDYTVWSEVFTCPTCGSEIVFYEAAFDKTTEKVLAEFACSSCGTGLKKPDLKPFLVTRQDPIDGAHRSTPKRTPVLIAYRVGGKKHTKSPDDSDLEVIARASDLAGDLNMPSDVLPYSHMTHERNIMSDDGIVRFSDFWLPRARISLSRAWAATSRAGRLQMALRFWIEQAFWTMSLMNTFRPAGFSQNSQHSKGFYHVPGIHAEVSFDYCVGRKKRTDLIKVWTRKHCSRDGVAIATGSSVHSGLPDDSVDYVFVDPPFGENFYYADLNYLLERWHGVVTDDDQEAIVSRSKQEPRSLSQYQGLMSSCFAEFRRVLKPGRWMTVEFNNSRNEVWLAIQTALAQSGFVVADTRVIDKEMASYRQATAKNAVKRDLIITAYRPSRTAEQAISKLGQSEEAAWAFVREHLGHAPVLGGSRGDPQAVRERRPDVLWDRLCAFFVQRQLPVPMTASEFYTGLERRFPVRDDMYFLSEQVEAYERHRMTVKELVQAELFITNEHSAIQWLRQFLKRKPGAYAEVQPAFFAELQTGLPDWEALPELRELLEESFLQDDQGRWYVPDPKKAEDLEKLRTRALLREFEAYRAGKGRLDRFRSEAVRAGFKDAWARRDFATIVTVGKRLPDDAFVEDEALLYYYDNARRLAGDS